MLYAKFLKLIGFSCANDFFACHSANNIKTLSLTDNCIISPLEAYSYLFTLLFLDPNYVFSFLPLFPFYLEIVAFELISEQSVDCETVYRLCLWFIFVH